MLIQERKHEKGEDLQNEPAVKRDLHLEREAIHPPKRFRYDPKELVEQEQKRDGKWLS